MLKTKGYFIADCDLEYVRYNKLRKINRRYPVEKAREYAGIQTLSPYADIRKMMDLEESAMYAYVSVVTNWSYVRGLAAMLESLQRTKPKWPICIVVPEGKSLLFYETVRKLGGGGMRNYRNAPAIVRQK